MIKSCPFCGNLELESCQHDIEDREGIPMSVVCPECGCQGPWCYIKPELKKTLSEENLLKHIVDKTEWNTRAEQKTNTCSNTTIYCSQNQEETFVFERPEPTSTPPEKGNILGMDTNIADTLSQQMKERTPEERLKLLQDAHILDKDGNYCEGFFSSETIEKGNILNCSKHKIIDTKFDAAGLYKRIHFGPDPKERQINHDLKEIIDD